MDINQVNPSDRAMSGSDRKPVGPMIGLIIIIVIIILGGIYFWVSRTNYGTQPVNNGNQQSGSTMDTNSILTQDSSDDPAAIENDLNAFNSTDIDSIDSQL